MSEDKIMHGDVLLTDEKPNTEDFILLDRMKDCQEMFREAELFMHHGFWEIDVQTDQMFWSEGIYHLFGYETEEIGNGDKLNREIVHLHLPEDYIEKYEDEWQNILREKQCYLREMEITTLAGKKKRLETFGKVFRDDAGKVLKVCGITREVTKLREFESALEVKVSELSRSNKELENFAFMASHDLQEPLRKLSTFGEKLQESAKEILTDEHKNYLARMLKATENMKHLINSLLDFSLITQTEKKFEKVSLDLILKQVLIEQELKIEETKAVIQIEDLPVIEAVSSQMKQLFNNLIHNALKFSSKDQQPHITIVQCEVTPEEKENTGLVQGMSYYKMVIKDNGIGFDARETEQIFQIFKRLHAKYEYSGSGIGLAICRKIIDYHHGVIYAVGSPGKGASFSVILPQHQKIYHSL